MGLQYACGSEERRRRVASLDGSGGRILLHGIDFLEVMDGELPAALEPWRQRLLLLRCFHPIDATGLTASHVAIDGGVRVQDVRVLDAGPLVGVVAAPSPAFAPLASVLTGVRDRLDADPTDDPRNWFVVLADRRGDFSTYTLALVAGAGEDAQPPGFDPILSRVGFSFKVECPSGFDCAPVEEADPEPTVAPSVDYLARDYASFRQLMLDRMSVTLRDWRERSPADLGVALVEVLAYAADQVAYHQDAVATEAYLGTARTRPSVRRHARLLDYRMHEGCNARAWVHVEVDDTAGEPVLPRGTPVLARVPEIGTRAVMTEAEADALSPDLRLQFETLHDVRLRPAHNRIELYTWGETECTLPVGATGASLRDSTTEPLQLAAGDVLVLVEERGPDSGVLEDADPRHRHAVRITAVRGRVDPAYDDQPVLDVEWSDDDALPFDLPLRSVDVEDVASDGTSTWRTEPASVALGNIVLADHGRAIGDQALQPDQVDRDEHFSAWIAEPELTFAVPFDPDVAAGLGAASALAQDPREALPAIELTDGSGDTWDPVADLLASGPSALEIVVEMHEDRRAWVRFGDGVNGAHPALGDRLTARYRVGNGLSGNVGIDALQHLVSDALPGIVRVRNPLAAVGGTAPEPLEQVRLHAPAAFRTQERAVTEADWAEVAQRHPSVQRAVATIRWTGSWHTVFVSVDRYDGLEVDADFVEELLAFLEPYRLAGYDLEIDPPVFVPLDIALSVCVAPGHFRAHVEQALYTRFGTVVTRGRKGFFHPDNYTFGQSVYLSQVVAAAMEVPGVARVDTDPDATDVQHRFQRQHEVPLDELREGVIPMARLEIARLDHDPNKPENGRIAFYLRGGL